MAACHAQQHWRCGHHHGPFRRSRAKSKVRQTPFQQRKADLQVLVWDDVKEVAQVLRMLLEYLGQEVRIVHDGPAAVVPFRAYQPDVVLLDIGLPGMNGYDVARQLRKDQGGKKSLLVAVTGYGGEEQKRLAHEVGFDFHMMKPIDPDKLAALLTSAHALP